ncbi:MAG: hypothetical protein AAGJ35_08390 [Myxococcota bacterium]
MQTIIYVCIPFAVFGIVMLTYVLFGANAACFESAEDVRKLLLSRLNHGSEYDTIFLSTDKNLAFAVNNAHTQWIVVYVHGAHRNIHFLDPMRIQRCTLSEREKQRSLHLVLDSFTHSSFVLHYTLAQQHQIHLMCTELNRAAGNETPTLTPLHTCSNTNPQRPLVKTSDIPQPPEALSKV